MVRAEITHSIPISGSAEEVNFSVGTNDLLWIRFEDDIGDIWLGKFGYGIKRWKDSRLLRLSVSIFFVSAGGQGYFVDAIAKKVIKKTDVEDIEDCIVAPNFNGTILANDGLRILVLGIENDTWKSQRFSFDGIDFVALNGDLLTGKFNDLSEDWANFTFEIANRKLQCDHWIDFEQNKRIRPIKKLNLKALFAEILKSVYRTRPS